MKQIAIIDDDPDIIETISTVLTKHGFEVISANNVIDAENIILSENPDLAILDVMMEEPDDGFFLAQKLRKRNFKNPIILLTSISKTLGFEYGESSLLPIDKFLEKPISPAKLLSVVNEIITEHGGKNESN